MTFQDETVGGSAASTASPAFESFRVRLSESEPHFERPANEDVASAANGKRGISRQARSIAGFGKYRAGNSVCRPTKCRSDKRTSGVGVRIVEYTFPLEWSGSSKESCCHRSWPSGVGGSRRGGRRRPF